jgi:citrate synthase
MAARRSRCSKCSMPSARRERIKPWIDAALDRGERLMGFGHRIYRVRDPRADVLKSVVEKLGSNMTDLGFAAEVEAAARAALQGAQARPAARHQCRVLHRDPARRAEDSAQAFTPMFAVARSAGWTAHAREQQRLGRLLRPSSLYVRERPAA